jgi:hypothetical protein
MYQDRIHACHASQAPLMIQQRLRKYLSTIQPSRVFDVLTLSPADAPFDPDCSAHARFCPDFVSRPRPDHHLLSAVALFHPKPREHKDPEIGELGMLTACRRCSNTVVGVVPASSCSRGQCWLTQSAVTWAAWRSSEQKDTDGVGRSVPGSLQRMRNRYRKSRRGQVPKLSNTVFVLAYHAMRSMLLGAREDERTSRRIRYSVQTLPNSWCLLPAVFGRLFIREILDDLDHSEMWMGPVRITGGPEFFSFQHAGNLFHVGSSRRHSQQRLYPPQVSCP